MNLLLGTWITSIRKSESFKETAGIKGRPSNGPFFFLSARKNFYSKKEGDVHFLVIDK